MTSRRIQTKKIYEEVADSLVNMIKSGELKSGDRLDSVEQLAKTFDVSRSAVREALSGMRAMGLIVMRQGEGTFVTNFDASSIKLPINTGLLMNKEDIREIYEVRKILEVGAARSAALHHQPEDLIPIRAALEAMERAINNGEVGAEADMQFHMAVAKSSHNDILIHLMSSVSEIMLSVLEETRQVLIHTEKKTSTLIAEHQAIYDAIKERVPEKAYDHMLSHLTNVEKSLEKYMKFRE
ncbi:FadR/GntR family transcriptional regulator [Sporosarcina pasteurii]|uniref:L-lactate utilization operon repressor n=1 Tax=Sporosarcina pasteurii TaxID=1474 RepID=A0A380BDK7_SPOPA|nr:FadR/GntR family transcriptional regulator [Sporosarcina pasteurii]MDS9472921.1 FadR/GntR family transcriptional regulator [Sporosarcina pasteurii]QBQ06464.1 FadR family transcriptional regulator [Sporosarcina pasteurii]SUI98421.1 L-lactate utilization operon repressor [Sporosarcina pasteurii]